MLVMPMTFSKEQLHTGRDGVITSLFGPRPALNDNHEGIDLGRIISAKSPVYAVMHGVVDIADSVGASSAGKYVRIDHGLGVRTRYLHLDSVAVTKGQYLKAGTILGTMGWTGQVVPAGPGGAHLHFDISIKDKRVDPLPYLQGNAGLPGDLVPIELDGKTIAWGRLVGKSTMVGENNLRDFADHLGHEVIRWLDGPRLAVLAPKKGMDRNVLDLAKGHCETAAKLLEGVLE